MTETPGEKKRGKRKNRVPTPKVYACRAAHRAAIGGEKESSRKRPVLNRSNRGVSSRQEERRPIDLSRLEKRRMSHIAFRDCLENS